VFHNFSKKIFQFFWVGENYPKKDIFYQKKQTKIGNIRRNPLEKGKISQTILS